MRTGLSLAMTISTLLGTPLIASAVPSTLPFQGRLYTPHGQPQAGTPTIVFKLFAQETGGIALWSETLANVPLTNGLYSVRLGATVAFPDGLFASDSLWVEETVDGTTLSPRLPLSSVPFAFQAKSLAGGTVDATSLKVNGQSLDARYQSKLTAGPGITLGADGSVAANVSSVAGRTGNVTLGLSDVGLPSCTAGQVLKSNGLGAFTCQSDNDTIFTLPPATSAVLGGVKQGAGVSVAADGTLAANVTSVAGKTGTVTLSAADVGLPAPSTCTNGQSLRVEGGAYACFASATGISTINGKSGSNVTLGAADVGVASPMLAKAWATFFAWPVAGLFAATGNTLTLSISDHGNMPGNTVDLSFPSQPSLDGTYKIDSVTANTYNVTTAQPVTASGAVTQNVVVRGSFNIDSIQKISTGSYSVALSSRSGITSSEYAVIVSSTNNGTCHAHRTTSIAVQPTPSRFAVACEYGGGSVDAKRATVVVFSD